MSFALAYRIYSRIADKASTQEAANTLAKINCSIALALQVARAYCATNNASIKH